MSRQPALVLSPFVMVLAVLAVLAVVPATRRRVTSWRQAGTGLDEWRSPVLVPTDLWLRVGGCYGLDLRAGPFGCCAARVDRDWAGYLSSVE